MSESVECFAAKRTWYFIMMHKSHATQSFHFSSEHINNDIKHVTPEPHQTWKKIAKMENVERTYERNKEAKGNQSAEQIGDLPMLMDGTNTFHPL